MLLRGSLLVMLFAALILLAVMYALAASGHFSASGRKAELGGARGTAALFGSMAVVVLSLLAGVATAATALQWYAMVIGGGAAMLLAPLALQRFSDRFVDGYGALIWLAGGAAAMSALIGYSLALASLR